MDGSAGRWVPLGENDKVFTMPGDGKVVAHRTAHGLLGSHVRRMGGQWMKRDAPHANLDSHLIAYYRKDKQYTLGSELIRMGEAAWPT